MAGLVEAGGGLLLAFGFLTPLAAAIVFSVMLGRFERMSDLARVARIT